MDIQSAATAFGAAATLFSIIVMMAVFFPAAVLLNQLS